MTAEALKHPHVQLRTQQSGGRMVEAQGLCDVKEAGETSNCMFNQFREKHMEVTLGV